jgi:hypothetical protein
MMRLSGQSLDFSLEQIFAYFMNVLEVDVTDIRVFHDFSHRVAAGTTHFANDIVWRAFSIN